MAISADGQTVAITTNGLGRASVFERGIGSTWTPRSEFYPGQNATIRLNADGTMLAVAHDESVAVLHYNETTYEELWSRVFMAPVGSVAISRDGRRLVYLVEHLLYVMDAADARWRSPAETTVDVVGGASLSGGTHAVVAGLSRDGRTVLLTIPTDGQTAAGVHWDPAMLSEFSGMDYQPNVGMAQVWTLREGLWRAIAYLKAPVTKAGSFFGTGAAIAGERNTIVVGAPWDRPAEAGEGRLGVVYEY